MSGFFGGGGTAPVNMTGATSSVTGTAGYVSAPAAGEEHKLLRGDATFQGVPFPQKLLSSSTSDITNQNSTGNVIGMIGMTNLTSSGNYLFYYNRQYFVPVWIPSTLTSWSLNVVVGSSPVNNIAFKIGVYDRSTSTGLVGNRVSVSSAQSLLTSTSGGTIFTVAFTDTLNQGLYFLSFCGGTLAIAPTMQGNTVPSNTYVMQTMSMIGACNRAGSTGGFYKLLSTGYGTDDFPSSMGSTGYSTGDQFPRMYITY